MTSFFVFDRWGKQLGILSDIVSAKHIDELNGEDSLTLELQGEQLTKGQRIVWKDKFGTWHEHTVSDLTVSHTDGAINTSAYCENSIAELLTDYVVWKKPNGNASILLTYALENSRWTNGTVNVLGSVRTSWFHISAYEAVIDIVEQFGGELSTTIEVNGAQVTGRKVNIVTRRGADNGRLFAYGRNLVGIERTIDPGDVYTALYGYGKGLPNYNENDEATGGFQNKLTFGSVNGGVNWVGDDATRLVWGVPDGKGGIKHAFGQVEFSECEDPRELLALTKQALEQAKVPTVSYTATVAAFTKAGFVNGEDVRTGDTVYIRDKDLNERISGRALKVERDLLDEANTVITLGNLVGTLTSSFKKQQANLDWLKNRSVAWDDATSAGVDWLNHLIKNLNDQFDAVGNYQKTGWELGMIWSSVPLDDNGNPTKTPAMAIQITGAGFRIASSVNANGEFDWRTFGTGQGFTADCINAGVIQGGANWWDLSAGDLQFLQGRIGDTEGYTYWDISNKEFVLIDKNGQGLQYKDGKLNIDAASVTINTVSIQDWTNAQIKASGNEINLSVSSQMSSMKSDVDSSINGVKGDVQGVKSDIQGVKGDLSTTATELRSEIKMLADEISLKVSKGDMESSIKAAVGNISLSVKDGALGSKASITMTVGDQTKTADLNLQGVRNAFAKDNSAITIQAGTVTFKSNTFVVDSTNFKVKADGTITATAGTIGGYTITKYTIENNTVKLFAGGIHFNAQRGSTWVRAGGVSASYAANALRFYITGVNILNLGTEGNTDQIMITGSSASGWTPKSIYMNYQTIFQKDIKVASGSTQYVGQTTSVYPARLSSAQYMRFVYGIFIGTYNS